MYKWSLTIIEQDAEDITVHCFDTEDEAKAEMRKIWKRDVATEVVESSRYVDFNKSHCVEYYAELWYLGSSSPIRYFVEEITRDKMLSNSIKNLKVIVNDDVFTIGDTLSLIELKNPNWNKGSIMEHNVEIIAIGNSLSGEFIVISNGDTNGFEYLNKIRVDEIVRIERID